MRVDIQIEKLIFLIENGLTVKEISEEFGVNISTIKRRMRENGLKSNFSKCKTDEITCIECKCHFQSLKSRERKFCSTICSNKHNINNKKNITKTNKVEDQKKCLNCETEIKNIQKYCSVKCQVSFQMMLRVNGGDASPKTLKRFLIELYGEKCMECGWNKMNPKSCKIPIELEHIDGNSENNSIENLKLLCPNCHSLTPTYKALNKGSGRKNRNKKADVTQLVE